MKKNSNIQLVETLTYLSENNKSIPEQDLIKKFALDSTWYSQTFRGGDLINSVHDDQTDRHMVRLSAKGISLLSDLTKSQKSWHEKPAGQIIIGLIIAVATLILERLLRIILQP
jgi:hypothetical protein